MPKNTQEREMVPNSKKFDTADYKLSDATSKQLGATFLLEKDANFNFKNPLDEQKELFKKGDFLIHYRSKPILVETEQKRVWTSSDGSFPYETIDVPTRKWESKANLYIMFNLNFDVLALTEMRNVLDAEVITKSTRRANGERLTEGETFFHVPVEKFEFYTRTEAGWVKA